MTLLNSSTVRCEITMVNILKEIFKVHDYLEEVGPFCGEVSDHRAGVTGEGQTDRPGQARPRPTEGGTDAGECAQAHVL